MPIFVLYSFDLETLVSFEARRIEGVGFVVVRELTGGIYFGEHILKEDTARDINDYSGKSVGLCAKPSRSRKDVVSDRYR